MTGLRSFAPNDADVAASRTVAGPDSTPPRPAGEQTVASRNAVASLTNGTPHRLRIECCFAMRLLVRRSDAVPLDSHRGADLLRSRPVVAQHREHARRRRGSAGRRRTPARRSRSGTTCVAPSPCPIPHQRLPQRRRQPLHSPRQRRHHRRRIRRGQPREQHEARLPLDECGDLRPALPHQQVAFPVARHRAGLDTRRPVRDGHDVDELARAPLGPRPARGRR